MWLGRATADDGARFLARRGGATRWRLLWNVIGKVARCGHRYLRSGSCLEPKARRHRADADSIGGGGRVRFRDGWKKTTQTGESRTSAAARGERGGGGAGLTGPVRTVTWRRGSGAGPSEEEMGRLLRKGSWAGGE